MMFMNPPQLSNRALLCGGFFGQKFGYQFQVGSVVPDFVRAGNLSDGYLLSKSLKVFIRFWIFFLKEIY